MRDGLALRYVRGDMADLSAFRDAAFDLIFHAVSNVFVPDLQAGVARMPSGAARPVAHCSRAS